MIHVEPNTRFVDITWYLPDLDLSTNYSWKPFVNKLESIRNTTTAFDTNTGVNAVFPSLTYLRTNKTYRLDAKNVPSNGFDIDNGSLQTGDNNADRLIANFNKPNAALLLAEFPIDASNEGTYQLQSVVGNPTNIVYSRNAVQASLPIYLVAGDILTITVSTTTAATITLIKQ
jgi:hypothetical protein